MLNIRVIVLVVLAAALAGCNVIPTKSYCDAEVSYNLWKQKSSYRLYLRVGTVPALACRTRPDASREINLSQDVSSPEEADKLIDKYRQIYAEKVTVRKIAQSREGIPDKK